MDKIYQCKKCGLNVVVASEFELRDWGGIDCTGFKTLRAQNAVPNTTHDFKYFGFDTPETMRRAENFGSPAGNINLGSSYTSENNSGIGKFLGNVVLGIVGLVVLAFANGGPEVFNNLFDALLTPSVSMGEDPKNYYGQYFGSVNSVGIVSIEIDSQEITITAMSGISVETNTYTYDYVSADYAQSRVNATNFSGYDAIFAYQTSDQEMILPFWVISNQSNNYEFLSNTNNVSFTREVITFETLLNDPKNYFGSYYYGGSYVILNNDYTARLRLDAGETTWKFLYGNRAYNISLINEYIDHSIILYQEGSNRVQVFEILNSNQIRYDSLYIFNKN